MKVMTKQTPDVVIQITEYNEVGSGSNVKEIPLLDTNMEEVYELIMKAIKGK